MWGSEVRGVGIENTHADTYSSGCLCIKMNQSRNQSTWVCACLGEAGGGDDVDGARVRPHAAAVELHHGLTTTNYSEGVEGVRCVCGVRG